MQLHYRQVFIHIIWIPLCFVERHRLTDLSVVGDGQTMQCTHCYVNDLLIL